ncbi:HNH endonuclease [Sutcliffiella horikoshii]|uniref:HNH endonuclease n=1 Tax=Sutcliffiella horikoshii TaxID=79883 RepID=UPI00203EAA94|nr:HNH endonuclease [Sutcliffiella horikoshii]MCM3616688.1 HNH endonuclease [Sutcliffiella horikoshii]
MALLKLCGCGKKISAGIARCEECEGKRKNRHKAYNKSVRNKESESFYNSKEWKIVRNRVADRDVHLCQLCLSRKKIKPLEIVHHIKEYLKHKELGLLMNNLLGVCAQCHRLIHIEYEKNESARVMMEKVLQAIVKAKGEKR